MKKLLALLIIIVAVLAFSVWSGSGKIRFMPILEQKVEHSEEVVLERFYGDTVIQSASLSKEEFKALMDQLPGGLGRMPSSNTKCWVPHHRIKFRGSKEDMVEICFTCNELWTAESGRRKIPEDWRQPLRAIYTASNIPDSAPSYEEYNKFQEAMFEAEEENAE